MTRLFVIHRGMPPANVVLFTSSKRSNQTLICPYRSASTTVWVLFDAFSFTLAF
ncbi:hypothetical protein IWQ54_004761 [Labrenzia sp. EL_195]|nr:hypothetical protein [Labrenzia sp. EL_195]